MTARGIRLNNPGNIRIGTSAWYGKLTPSTDPDFEQFDTPEHGIRALAKLLLTYQISHGLDTIRQLVSKWAPDSENDTQAYIDQVCGQTGLPADQRIDLTVLDVLASVTEAII